MKTFIKKNIFIPIFYPINLIHSFHRTIQDYLGSCKVKKYFHSSKKIRSFKDNDLVRILDLENECFGKKYYPQLIKYSKLFRNIFYVYEEDGIIVAYFGFYIHLKFDNFKLVQKATFFSGCVDEQKRDKGLFQTIYEECLSELKSNNVKAVYGCIRVNNAASLHVHQKLGFKIIDKKSKMCGGDNFYQYELQFDEKYSKE